MKYLRYLFIASWVIFALLTGQWYIWLLAIPTLGVIIIELAIEDDTKKDPRWNMITARSTRTSVTREHEDSWNKIWWVTALMITYRLANAIVFFYMLYIVGAPLFGIASD